MAIPDHARPAFKGKDFTVWQWEQELFDGTTATFETVGRVDASMVIAVLPNKNILIIQDEQPHRGPLLSVPGGRLDEGEDPKVGAKREFEEETGYVVNALEHYFTDPFFTWKLHYYIGKDLEQVGEPEQSPGEKITLYEYSFDDFINLGCNPEFRNTELRLRLLEAAIDPEKKQGLHDLLYK